MDRRIRRVAVFCGSSPGVDPELSRRSYDVGRGLAERGIGVVYGAGGSGLMREVSQGALGGLVDAGFVRAEVLDDLVVTDDLDEALDRLTGRLDANIGDKPPGRDSATN